MSTERSRGPRPARRPRSRGAGRGDRAGAGRGGRTEWLHGFHAVREALRARRRGLHRLWIEIGAGRADDAGLVTLAEASGVVVERVERAAIEARCPADVRAQGVALEAEPLPESSLAQLLAGLGAGPARLLALDGVEDPQNVGALARVALSAGVAGLILTDRRAPPLSPALARASAGAIEWLPVARVPNLPRALASLKENDFWILGAAAEASTSLYAIEDRLVAGRLCVVMGAEGRGLRPSVLGACDHRVHLPMLGEVASLNVSNAAAAILYELVRREQAHAAT